MTDWEVVLVTLAAAVLAVVAPAVPWWTVAIVAVMALVVRHPALVGLALVLVVAARAHDAVAGLEGARPGPVSGTVTVLSDPVVRFGSWQFDARRGSEHDAVEIPRAMTEEPVVGQHLTVRGSVAPLHPVGGLLARHLRSRLQVSAIVGRSPPDLPLRAANAVRDLLTRGTSSLGDDRPLFSGLVLGDDRAQTPLLTHQFRASGLAHLLAVSGQNVAFVLVAVSPLLARGSLRWRWAVTLVVLVGFTLVTRWEPSVLRAVVMAGIAATAHWRGRYASGLRRTGLAVLVLLVADPLLVWSAGFRLSVAATVALVVLQRPIARSLPGPRWFVDPLATVLAAQAGTAPLLLSMGATVTVASLPANLVAVPVAGWVMVWGLTAGFLAGALPGPIATLIHRPTAAMLWWIRSVAGWASSARWPAIGALSLALVAAALAIRWLVRSPAVRAVAWVPAMVTIALAAWSPPAGRWTDVGGVTMWRSAGGQVVVASGGATDVGRLLDELTRLRVARIDVLVLTGTGSSTSTLADTVRHAADVGTVLAADGLVRDARPLAAGLVQVGTIRVRLAQVDGRWRASEPGVG
jgi:competence protein ComEC